MKYIIYLSAFLILGCKAPVSDESREPSLEKATVVSYQNLNVIDFKHSIESDEIVVLDVRTPEELDGGQIEGAINLNFYDDDFAERLLALDKEKGYYVYCKGGGRSAKTCRLLIKNGYENVANLEGGYQAWKKQIDD